LIMSRLALVIFRAASASTTPHFARSVNLSHGECGLTWIRARQDRPLVGEATQPVRPDTGSGLHFCFSAPTREAVDGFHVAALSTGGADNGAPGLRSDYGADYYAAFVVDPDGYRLEAYVGG
jgi:catechol 2,3-dioxygenase-like lactoylglutathione lyase family enzyme